MGYMIGVDVGGTFTDFSLFDTANKCIAHHKRSSTPDDPSRAIMDGILQIMADKRIKPEEIVYLAHGTTVATNALIEKRGAKIALVTTRGFRDLMEIGWQRRPSLYDLHKQKPQSILALGQCYEVTERILHDGSVKTPLSEEETRSIARSLKNAKVQSVAVCTLFSFLNPTHERQIKKIITEEYPDVYITTSHELVPEFREYARMSTTVLNAFLGPVMKQYVQNFERTVLSAGIEVAPYVTQSNGSIISIAETIDHPIKTAVSGPSAGVIGAIHIGKQCGADNVITFDMGGTSADVCLINNGEAQLSNDRLIEGYPVRVPMIDIITIGAGGGSIASIDSGGAMKVGPISAGAVPGPACYKNGGEEPTVTDANIVLGKLNPYKILGGTMEVDRSLAERVIQNRLCSDSALSVREAARGIISVVNSNMVRAIRLISIERGYDVREFSLMAFGGAGPLHACEVAEEMGIKKVIFPPAPGTLCSLGLLMADTRFDLGRSRLMLATPDNVGELYAIFCELVEEGNRMLENEGIPVKERSFLYSVDCRYLRQNYEINISINGVPDEVVLDAMCMAFHEQHDSLYGYRNEETPIQMVNYRISAIGFIKKPESLVATPFAEDLRPPPPKEIRDVFFSGAVDGAPTPIYDRGVLLPGHVMTGPVIIEQMDSTCVVPPGWEVVVDKNQNIQVNLKRM